MLFFSWRGVVMILITKLFTALLLYCVAFFCIYIFFPGFRRRETYIPVLSLLLFLVVALLLLLPGFPGNSILTYSLYGFEIFVFTMTMNRLILFSCIFLSLVVGGIFYRQRKIDDILISGFMISIFLFSGNILTTLTGIILSLILLFLYSFRESDIFSRGLQTIRMIKGNTSQENPKSPILKNGEKPIVIILTLYFIVSITFIIIGMYT